MLFVLPFLLNAQQAPIVDTFRVAFVKKINEDILEITLKYHNDARFKFYAICKDASIVAGDSIAIRRPGPTTKQVRIMHKGKEYLITPKQ